MYIVLWHNKTKPIIAAIRVRYLYYHYCCSSYNFIFNVKCWTNPCYLLSHKHTYPLFKKIQTGMKENFNTDKLILYFSIHDLIAKCCTTNPWHGYYFNSILQPAENWGLRLRGSCVYVHMFSFVCVCLCWLACVAAHMWAVIGILLLSTVQRPKLCWTEKIPEPGTRQRYRVLCLL